MSVVGVRFRVYVICLLLLPVFLSGQKASAQERVYLPEKTAVPENYIEFRGKRYILPKSAVMPEAPAAPTALPSEKAEAHDVVSINTAPWSEISRVLKGVGESKAKAIVSWRMNNGPFRRIEQLLRVKGIGPAILDKNRHRMLFN